MGESGGAPEFGKVRSVLWPIHGFELKKFLPMSILMFCVLFVYTAVRDLKDIFVQKYAVLGGPELISALKLWFVLPVSFVVAGIFASMVSKLGMKKTFYIISSFYALFFFIFAFFLFPNRDVIHMNASGITSMRESWPRFFYYIVPCLGNWSYSLFYILAEIWGSLAISSLFWFLANQITKKTEVKRFFGLYSLLGNVGTFIAGSYIYNMSHVKGAAFDGNVKLLSCIAGVFSVATMLTYYYITKVVMTDPTQYDPSQVVSKKKKKKIGFFDGIKVIATNNYLFLIFLLPIGYGIGMNLYEGVWKAQMAQTLTNASDYARMQGIVSMATAIMTFVLTFIGANIMRRTSWKFSALTTPVLILGLGLLFFVLMFVKSYGLAYIMGMSVPLVAVWVGLMIDAMGKGIKYVLFDSTKSMAYIPLDEQTKAYGQASVELIGGRSGKAGGALITYTLLNFIAPGSLLLSHTYTMFVLFAIIMVVWIWAVIKLNRSYVEKVKEQELRGE
ncbi:MAG: NTP/NDP exchange transporter [Oscillospiraceae bacterium]|jgi:AAA family ATP:ADP antiporter|nr:NTP/NDP exchange transporter [Oscillospiraceae bacterium]